MLVQIPCSNLNEVVSIIRRQSIDLSQERYFIAGPCGIGKTTLGKALSRELNICFIDHDDMKEKVKLVSFPCSINNLNLEDCLKESLIVEGNPNAFIFAVGGDSVFRVNTDNNERLTQVLQVKKKYGLVVVMLTAEHAILERRFLQVSERKKENFSTIWQDWENIEKANWERCADYVIETSELVL